MFLSLKSYFPLMVLPKLQVYIKSGIYTTIHYFYLTYSVRNEINTISYNNTCSSYKFWLNPRTSNPNFV